MILDLFAGPGGWDCGARTLGLDPIGIELDRDACATRAAAGLRTIRADVSTYPLEHMAGKIDGLIASPPCQDFSTAGKKAGIDGERGQLMFTVPAAVEALHPRWVACEQVPPAVEWWYRFADQFVGLGYRCWIGVLNAVAFGVPQTRRRAFLLASLDKTPAPPTPTHDRQPQVGLWGVSEQWVSMSDALGWDPDLTLRTGDRSENADGQLVPYERPVAGPAPTLDAKCVSAWRAAREWRNIGIVPAGPYRRLTVRDALVLQSFPASWPVKGSQASRARQVANAVPPRLASAVLECVV